MKREGDTINERAGDVEGFTTQATGFVGRRRRGEESHQCVLSWFYDNKLTKIKQKKKKKKRRKERKKRGKEEKKMYLRLIETSTIWLPSARFGDQATSSLVFYHHSLLLLLPEEVQGLTSSHPRRTFYHMRREKETRKEEGRGEEMIITCLSFEKEKRWIPYEAHSDVLKYFHLSCTES